MKKHRATINSETVVSPGISYLAEQEAPKLTERPLIEARAALPGYNKGRRAEVFWEGSPTTGSQLGHTNDGAFLWIWI
jgi:hypothetical protein